MPKSSRHPPPKSRLKERNVISLTQWEKWGLALLDKPCDVSDPAVQEKIRSLAKQFLDTLPKKQLREAQIIAKVFDLPLPKKFGEKA